MIKLFAKPGFESRLLLALGLHSVAIIAYQLVLMQVLSVIQWHHFAYMIISIAMLGFGASGTLVVIARQWFIKRAEWMIPMLMIISGLTMVTTFPLSRQELVQFDVYILFTEIRQFPRLAANYIIFFLPFFFGALAIGLIFILYAKKIGTYYFSNLIGSGIGGILVLLILSHLYPQEAFPLIAIIPVISGLIIISRKFRKTQLILVSISVLLSVLFFIRPPDITVSEYKSLSKTKTLPDAEIIHSEPNIYGTIDIAASPALRYAPGVSLAFQKDMPVKPNLFVNANSYGAIPKHDDSARYNIHDYTTMALPYIKNKRDTVLVLNATTGNAISHALNNNAKHVDGVIENSAVINLLKEDFSEESGNLFNHQKVNIIHQESRAFLNEHYGKNKYDLIALPLLDAFGGTTGLNALNEEYYLTKEAFQMMWEMLTPNGLIVVSSWMDYPPRTTLKIFATLAELANNNNIEDVEKHIIAIRSWGTITFAIKKTPVDFIETQKIRSFCENMFFDPVMLPDIDPEERIKHNVLEDDSFFDYIDELKGPGRKSIYKDYGFHIEPATDDKPYFSQFMRLNSLNYLAEVFGPTQMPFLEIGYLVVLLTFAQSFILALLFIIVPLFFIKKLGPGKTPTLLYFGALGLGYMFVEIILIQRFVLYFGHPIYAITAVISTMLLSSGAGSYYSTKISNIRKSAAKINLVIALILLFYAFGLTPILEATISNHGLIKIIFALFLIAIPSFFMGMPFPLGVKYLSQNNESHIGWAWGINGSISVIATSLAMLIAVEGGFRSVIIVALLSYFLAFGAMRLYKKHY